MNLLVQPSNSFNIPSVPTAVSVALTTLVPTAHTFFLLRLVSFTILHASALITICSESILCLVRSSTSISLKLPKPQCRVMKALLMPLISILFNSSLLKCKPVAGAVTAPSFLANIHWKFSKSSFVAWVSSRLSMIYRGKGASPKAYNSFLNSS